ncbi:rhomboid family intramembrane serine protease [Micrococcus sp. NPDC078436]|uniref:rhomboid family intramembrane serine protease n=1 Tax=Micrococcus sp. NPDC078436 TaxID=3154960 RepID=UPI0034507270
MACPACGRPACLECQRPAGGAMVCADCAARAAAPGSGAAATPSSAPARASHGRGGVLGALTAAPMTTGLIVLTALVYALQWLYRDPVTGVTPSLWYAGLYTSPLAFEPWRLLTYALVHDVSGPTHLALNLLALWVIGRVLEPVLGLWRFLALYAISALGGAVFALWTSAPLQPVVGASGAVYGLFAALFLLTRIGGGQVRSIAVLIGLNLAASFALPGISWQVHVGGLLTGAAVALVLTRLGPLPGTPGRGRGGVGAQVAGLVVVLAALGGLTALGASRIGLDALVM